MPNSDGSRGSHCVGLLKAVQTVEGFPAWKRNEASRKQGQSFCACEGLPKYGDTCELEGNPGLSSEKERQQCRLRMGKPNTTMKGRRGERGCSQTHHRVPMLLEWAGGGAWRVGLRVQAMRFSSCPCAQRKDGSLSCSPSPTTGSP